MFIDTIVKTMGCMVHHKSSRYSTAVISNILACDLMSDVLTTELDDILLVTSLTTDQAIRTADIVGAHGILFVNGKNIFKPIIDLAGELDITILVTNFSKFDACVALGRLCNHDPLLNVSRGAQEYS